MAVVGPVRDIGHIRQPMPLIDRTNVDPLQRPCLNRGFRNWNMRKLIALGLVAAALAVSACNTVSGMGRDMQAAGQAITGSSEKARR